MYKFVKRLLDIVSSILLLIILAPIMISIAVVVAIDTQTSPIFKAKRLGKNEQEFNIYKFRTMKKDTPVLPPGKFVDVHSYITLTGGVLRRLSLDELPQFVNVLLGEMSFVGPRPGAATNEEELRLERRKRGVFSVRPGITGWAQVNGRDELAHDIKAKSKHDQYYVEHLSIKMDMRCLLKTINTIRTQSGYSEGAKKSSVDSETTLV